MTTTLVIPEAALATGDTLNAWLSGTAHAANPADPQLVDVELVAEVEGAVIDAPYGLAVGNFGALSRFGGLKPYRVEGVTLDLQGATVAQGRRSNEDPGRTKYGMRMLLARDCVGLTIKHATFDGGAPLPVHFHADRADWLGLQFSGCTDLTLLDVHVQDTWSDGIYLDNHGTEPCRNVTCTATTINRAGRQGLTLNGIDGLTWDSTCAINNVAHCAIDCEPDANGTAANIRLSGTIGAGPIAAVNFNVPHRARIGDWTLDQITFPHRAPKIRGHLSTAAEGDTRGYFAMLDCRHVDPAKPYADKGPMIDLKGWRITDVRDCTAYVDAKHTVGGPFDVDAGNEWIDPAAAA